MSDHCQQLMLFDYPQLEKPSEKGIKHVGVAEVSYDDTKDILTRASGFMSEYDFTLNPYSGCSFGCTYCYAAFFATSKEKQDQWGYWVKVKDNAREKLDSRKKPLDGKLIYMSSVTDPYQPIERKLKLTQSLLVYCPHYNNNYTAAISRVCFARPTLSRISSTDFVQIKGFGFSLWVAI